jgi:integrase
MSKRRGNKEGSIYQDSDGRWRAAVDLGNRNGKRARKLLSARTRAEVATKLTAVLRSEQLGLPIAPERQTVGQFLAQWLQDVAKRNARPKTISFYSDITKHHLVPGLGRYTLAKLGPQHVQAFMNERIEAGFAPRTVKHMRDTLRNALNVAAKWNLVIRNAASLVEPPRREKTQVRAFTPEEARRFLEAIRGHRLEAIFSLCLSVGLRQGEALGLRWEDLDFETRTLTIRYQLQRINGKLTLVEPKTEKSRRSISLPQIAVSALSAHQELQRQERELAGSRWIDTGMVFTTSTGTMLDKRCLLRAFYGIVRASGLKPFRFHDLRHSAATLLLAQGMHPRAVMELLGHSDFATTMNIYSHVIPAVQKELADRMDAILAPVASNLASTEILKRPN